MMNSARILVLASFAVAFLGACSRPGEKRCTEVCEHYLDLYLASEFDDKLKNETDDAARAELEKKRRDERAARRNDAEFGFDKCVNRCNRRARGEVADCVMKAETMDQAKACEPSDDSACSASRSNGPDRPPLGTAVLLVLVLGLLARNARVL